MIIEKVVYLHSSTTSNRFEPRPDWSRIGPSSTPLTAARSRRRCPNAGHSTSARRPAAARDIGPGGGPGAPIAGPPAVTGARLTPLGAGRVQVAWDAATDNPFIIGTSTLGGGDVLTSSFVVDFDGPYDELVGMEGYGVKSVRTNRGRDDYLGEMAAGTATVVLHDPDGRFNPKNAASPLYGQLLPMRQIRIRASNDGGAIYQPMFRGFIRSIEHNPNRGVQETTIECVDLFVWMNRVKPVIESITDLTTGGAIAALLADVGWTVEGLVDLDDGDAIPAFSADGSATALSLVGDLLETERGLFYVKADGTARYEDRYTRSLRSSAASFSDTMKAATSRVDLDEIGNRAVVTRTGGEAQTAVNGVSQDAYGTADVGDIESPYLATDAQALSLANYLVSVKGEPRSAMWEFGLMNRDADTMTQILERELGDRITVSDSRGGSAGDYYIESIAHEVTDGGKFHRWSATLSERGVGEVFVIGTSTLGGGDVLAIL